MPRLGITLVVIVKHSVVVLDNYFGRFEYFWIRQSNRGPRHWREYLSTLTPCRTRPTLRPGDDVVVVLIFTKTMPLGVNNQHLLPMTSIAFTSEREQRIYLL